MKPNRRNLKRMHDDRELVAIRRDEIDDNKIQGFVLCVSNELVLFQYIYDFHLDGLMLLRIRDITDLNVSKTERFQKELLVEEGFFEKIDFELRPPISSYEAFLRSLPEDELVILEDEIAEEPEFLIGPVLSIDGGEISIRFFTGAANWEKEPRVIEISEVTSCQVGSNYLWFYARYFERKGK